MTPAPLRIRSADRDDLPALLDLYQHLTPGDDRPTLEAAAAILDRFLAYAGSALLIGEAGPVPAASCTLVVIPNLTRGGNPYGLIENVVTHGDFRNRGYGKQLLDAACDMAWQAGCYKVMLMTGSTKPETLNFYRAAGFEPSKTGFEKRRLAVGGKVRRAPEMGQVAIWGVGVIAHAEGDTDTAAQCETDTI